MNLRPSFMTRSGRVSMPMMHAANGATPPARRRWQLRRATKVAEKEADKAVSRLSRLQLKRAALTAEQQVKRAATEANQAYLQRMMQAAQHEADQAIARLSQLRLRRATLSVEKEVERSAAKVARRLRFGRATAKVGPGVGLLAAKIGMGLHLKRTTRKAERSAARLAGAISRMPVERAARAAGKRVGQFASSLGRRMELKRAQRSLYRALDRNALARRVLGRRAARRSIPRPLLIVLPVAGVGAGLAYLLNSEMGSSRRDAVREWSREAWHGAREFMPEAVSDLRRRAQDAIARVSGGPAPDEVLAERVRSALRFAVSHPKAIEVEARHGYIVLRGPALAADVDRLLRRIGEVPGVVSIENRLDVHQEAGTVPELQGFIAALDDGDMQGANWSPGIRLLAAVAGTTVAATSLRRSGPARIVGAIAGLLLALRGITNYQVTQISDLPQGAE